MTTFTILHSNRETFREVIDFGWGHDSRIAQQFERIVTYFTTTVALIGLDRAAEAPYYVAGKVDGESLDDAYRLTQNVTDSWADGQRSTSIGDIILDPEAGEAGVPFVVAPTGFREITEADVADALARARETL